MTSMVISEAGGADFLELSVDDDSLSYRSVVAVAFAPSTTISDWVTYALPYSAGVSIFADSSSLYAPTGSVIETILRCAGAIAADDVLSPDNPPVTRNAFLRLSFGRPPLSQIQVGALVGGGTSFLGPTIQRGESAFDPSNSFVDIGFDPSAKSPSTTPCLGTQAIGSRQIFSLSVYPVALAIYSWTSPLIGTANDCLTPLQTALTDLGASFGSPPRQLFLSWSPDSRRRNTAVAVLLDFVG